MDCDELLKEFEAEWEVSVTVIINDIQVEEMLFSRNFIDRHCFFDYFE